MLFGLPFGCARPSDVTAGLGARRDGIKIAIVCSPSGLSAFPVGQPPLRLKPFSFTFLKQGVKGWVCGRENGILVDVHKGRM